MINVINLSDDSGSAIVTGILFESSLINMYGCLGHSAEPCVSNSVLWKSWKVGQLYK